MSLRSFFLLGLLKALLSVAAELSRCGVVRNTSCARTYLKFSLEMFLFGQIYSFHLNERSIYYGNLGPLGLDHYSV